MSSPCTPLRQPSWPDCPYRVEPGVPAALPEPTLCAWQFGDASSIDGDSRRVRLPLRPLWAVNTSVVGELWLGSAPLRHGWQGNLGYAGNEQMLMVQLHLPEAALSDFEGAVCAVYQRLLQFTAAAGHPHLLRVWNYLSSINDGDGDAERYRRFCAGRYRALAQMPGFELGLPAASAIGSRAGDGLRVFALAGPAPGLQVENPQQVSAFRYPRDYGERSPSFSRATLAPWRDGAQLLVSGTASILGHATVHAGDAAAQLRQALDNLEAVRDQALRTHLPALPPAQLPLASALVYLRHADDLPALQPLLARRLGGVPLRVLAGDICRRDLLVEVEAVYRQSPEAACAG